MYYNHFREGKPGGYRGAGYPNHNDDAVTGKPVDANPADGKPDGTGGFGLFQLTYGQREKNYLMPRDWIWNWQSNVISGMEKLMGKRKDALDSFARKIPLNSTYPPHSVPRVRNPENVGSRTDNSDGDSMNAASQNGVIFGGDSESLQAPNGFPQFDSNHPDYRKATFNSRDGYIILDTIRRNNGGRYVYREGGSWRFNRWRGDGESKGVVDGYERKSYVDIVFDEIEIFDVPVQYRPNQTPIP